MAILEKAVRNESICQRVYRVAGLRRSIEVWRRDKSLQKPEITKKGLVQLFEENPEFVRNSLL
jgi:hypothetical protein